MNQPLLSDIKRYAINDGPGIRITIFFKGCSLACDWCHNPESQSTKVQKMYTESKCIACEECVKACEQNACTLIDGAIVTDSEACILCGKCADVCPTKATEMSGTKYSIEQIMKEIEKERVFMEQSGGGVTFSGGEPLMHSGFLIPLLVACRDKNIHTVVDTTGFAKKEILLEVAKRTDLFLFDLKMIDNEKHKEYTGVGTELILDNLKLLADIGANINIRIPLIKGVNDNDENIMETIQYLSSLPGEKRKINILPYHAIAAKKYEKLGGKYDAKNMEEPSEEMQMKISQKFEENGFDVVIGG
jgi:pyruvate formate lyase activating enzyme